jgi:protein-S-isoprenylcysteine O-methyltransferase Ste14
MGTRSSDVVGYVVNGLSIPLIFYLMSALDGPPSLSFLQWLGWVALAIGVMLVVLSITALARNRQGGLVQQGVFGLVRHPMYLGAMFLFSAFVFFCPHWLVLAVSSANIAIVYWFVLQGERQNAVKFGAAYSAYQGSVPRVNLLSGVFRRLAGRRPHG